MSQTPPSRAVQRVDFTARKPFPQSKDKRVKLVFDRPIAADDRLEIQFRETIGGDVIGTLSTESGDDTPHFEIDADGRTVWACITEENTRGWFRYAKVTEENRIRTVTGTLLHRDKDGKDYPWSGLLEISFRFELSWTRG